MKKPAIQFLLALGLGLSALSMSASALDYGTLRPRSTVDSTGLPSLTGQPLVKIGDPPVGGGLGTLAAVDLTFQTADGAGSVRYDCARGMGRLNATDPKTGAQLCPAGSGVTNENWFPIANGGGSDGF